MKRQRGVALITALLVVVLATIAAVAMTSRQQIDIRRTENLLAADQLRQYLYGIEGWTGKILEDDRKNNQVDNLGEDWATHLPPIPVENGQLAGYIEDAQSRFNVNDLITGDQASPDDMVRFQRLLVALDMDPTLAQAVVDWLDSNVDPWPPNGAEDDTYMSLQPAYRTANGLMGDASELMAVNGFTADLYRRITPYVIALPVRTSINLNTATAPVLMTLADNLNRADVDAFISSRGTAGYPTVAEALQQPPFAGKPISNTGLSVATDYFVVMSDIGFGRLQQRFRSLLKRDSDGKTQVLSRAQLYL